MDIKLDSYRIFLETARLQNISEAARALYISQPAVSQSIKQLESQIGIPLFHRTGKGVVLTAGGQLLYEYATSAMDLLTAAAAKLDAMKNLHYGDLKIGASDTISQYLLLNKLEQFHKTYPEIKLQIVNRTSLESISLLKTGKIDLAFVNTPIEDREIVFEAFKEVHDVFVGSAAYQKNCYSFTEIAGLPLILLERNSNSRRYVEQFFEQMGLSISPEIELGSHDLLLEFARIKLGVSCVIREFSEQHLQSGELFLLKTAKPIPARQISIAYLKKVSLPAAAVKFLEL